MSSTGTHPAWPPASGTGELLHCGRKDKSHESHVLGAFEADGFASFRRLYQRKINGESQAQTAPTKG